MIECVLSDAKPGSNIYYPNPPKSNVVATLKGPYSKETTNTNPSPQDYQINRTKNDAVSYSITTDNTPYSSHDEYYKMEDTPAANAYTPILDSVKHHFPHYTIQSRKEPSQDSRSTYPCPQTYKDPAKCYTVESNSSPKACMLSRRAPLAHENKTSPADVNIVASVADAKRIKGLRVQALRNVNGKRKGSTRV